LLGNLLGIRNVQLANLRIAQAALITGEDAASRAKPSCRKLMMLHLPALSGALKKALESK
jgi:hypothetical protein